MVTNGDEWRQMGRITVSYVLVPPPLLHKPLPADNVIMMVSYDVLDHVHYLFVVALQCSWATVLSLQSDDQVGQKRKRGVKMTPLQRANQFKGDFSFFLWSAYLIPSR